MASSTGKDGVVGAMRSFNFTGPDGPAGGYYQISEVVRKRKRSSYKHHRTTNPLTQLQLTKNNIKPDGSFEQGYAQAAGA